MVKLSPPAACILMALAGALPAQRYSFRHYSQPDGLQNLAVLCTMQDRSGFLWVGTQNGLFRYDGARFERFGTDSGLPGSRIHFLHEAPDGSLWVLTRSGLARWEKGRFRTVPLGPGAEIPASAGMVSDPEGRLYVGTTRGLAAGRLGPRGDPEFRIAPPPPAAGSPAVYGVHRDPSGVLWFGCGRRLCRLEGGEPRLWEGAAGLPPDRWDGITTDRAGNLWIRSPQRLLVKHKDSSRFVPAGRGLPRSSEVARIYTDSEGTLFVPTDQGLVREAGGVWDLVGEDQGLPDAPVSCVLRDHEGSVWIGVLGAGLFRWLGYGEWESFTRREGLSSDVIWAIRRDRRGTLWVGTNSGLNYATAGKSPWRVLTRRQGLAGDRIRTLATGPDGAVWTGSAPGGVSRIDPVRKAISRFGPESGLEHDCVYGLLFEREDLWVSTRGGLYRGFRVHGRWRFERQPVPLTDENELFLEAVRDRQSRLWFAGSRGLVLRERGRWTRFTTADGLRANYVGYLTESPDGALWVGYLEPVGVSRVTLQGGQLRVENVSPGQGGAAAQTLFLEADRHGRIWQGTDNGVNVYDGRAWRRITSAEGLIWNDCDSSAFFADGDGSVWIGTSRGLSHYRPGPRVAAQPAPRLTLTGVRFGEYAWDPAEPAEVPYLRRNFWARLAPLSFRNDGAVELRCRMAGLEEHWVRTESREVRYANLPPGDYVFEAAARAPQGEWGEPFRFRFRILAPWWTYWSVRLFAGAMAVLGLCWLWTRRIHRLLKLQKQLEAAVAARTQELQLEKEKYRALAEALRASQERFQLAARATNDAIWDWNLATNQVEWNESIQTLFGYTASHIEKDVEWSRDNIHPDDRARVLAGLRATLEGGGCFWSDEYRYRKADGSYAYVYDRGYVMYGEGGAPVRMIGAMLDLTERRRAEEDLRQNEERFRLLFEDSPVACHEVDADGIVRRVNRAECALFGVDRSEILGRPIFDFVVPAEREESRLAFERKMRGEPPLPFRRRYLRGDGTVLTLEVHQRAIRGSSGEVIGLRSVLLDITERCRAEAELRKARDEAEAANQAKSAFLANMSHEIRTPLNGVIGMTELALTTELSSEQREYLETARSCAVSLLSILNDILDLSKMEAGKLRLDPAPFDLRECISDALTIVARNAHAKGLELASSIAADIPRRLVGDAVRVKQVVLNLVHNAVKFTRQGEVVVRADLEALEGDAVRIHVSVADTGIGIPEEHQQRIFEAFEQADSSTSRKHGGTGLGLAICSRLVELMGGRLWVESQEKAGSAFHFTLRLGRQASAAPEPAVQKRRGWGGLPALVVDDSRTARELLAELLGRWGMAPEAVESVAAARRALEDGAASARPFRLVLLDGDLLESEGCFPEVQGPQTILMLNSTRAPEQAALGRRFGIFEHVVKPAGEGRLERAIASVLGAGGEKSALADPGPRVAALEPASSEPKVLVVEDSPVNRLVAIRLLEKLGCRPVTVSDGREALAALERGQFDVVLMDVQMPEMDGLACARAIRERERDASRRVPIVAMTAHAMAGDRERCVHAGMDDYVCKPVRMEELRAALDRTLGGRVGSGRTAVKRAALETFRRLSDPEEVRELLAVFLEESRRLRRELAAAIAAKDAARLAFCAHTLKGALKQVSTGAAADLAAQIETLGRARSLEGASALLARLEEEIDRLEPQLEAVVMEVTDGAVDQRPTVQATV